MSGPSSRPPAALRRRFVVLLALSLLLLAMGMLLSVSVGPAGVGLSEAIDALFGKEPGSSEPDEPAAGSLQASDVQAIVWSLRAPRAVLAAIVGASLALAGGLLQGLFRNVLAAPGVIGTSAGASFGAVLALSLGWANQSLLTLPACAMAGALLSLLIVVRIAQTQGRTPVSTLLLAGVALTAFLSAINGWLLARSYQDFDLARTIAYWMLGGVADRGWEHAALALPALVVGGALALIFANDLDLLLQGEETAATLGVDVERSRRQILVLAAVLVGSSVAVAGVIGFVGLVIPHVVRMILGPAHRPLLLLSAVLGGAFLVAADLVARTVAASELQLGIVTAFVGAPFFMYLLTQQRHGELQ